MKLLIIDNYDSFTYNLEHLFGQMTDVEVDVVRNNDEFLPTLEEKRYDGVIISPGPGTPLDEEYFGKNREVIERFGKAGLPILGICLGFQGIAAVFGAALKEAALPQHGKTSELKMLQNNPLMKNIPDKINVMRYHSLMIDMEKPFPDEIEIFAEVDQASPTVAQNGREIMGIVHKQYPIYGLQFHPESFATELGSIIAGNFVDIIKQAKS